MPLTKKRVVPIMMAIAMLVLNMAVAATMTTTTTTIMWMMLLLVMGVVNKMPVLASTIPMKFILIVYD